MSGTQYFGSADIKEHLIKGIERIQMLTYEIQSKKHNTVRD